MRNVKTVTLMVTAAAGLTGFGCVALLSSLAGPSLASATGAAPTARAESARAAELGSSQRQAAATEQAFVGVLLPEQATDIAAPQAGLVKVVHVALGQLVEPGQLLVSLSVEQATLELTRATAEREAARAALARARIEQEHAVEEELRSQQLAREGLLTQEQLAAARFKRGSSRAQSAEAEARLQERAARAQQLAVVRDQASVTARFRGRVAVRYTTPGAHVPAGAPLLRLISADAVLARFAVPEDVTKLRPGSLVALLPSEQPETRLLARVLRVSPEIDAASRMRTLEAAPLEPAEVVERGLVGAIVSVRSVGAEP
jgi:RND family efflux transporter MFP subunit